MLVCGREEDVGSADPTYDPTYSSAVLNPSFCINPSN